MSGESPWVGYICIYALLAIVLLIPAMIVMSAPNPVGKFVVRTEEYVVLYMIVTVVLAATSPIWLFGLYTWSFFQPEEVQK